MKSTSIILVFILLTFSTSCQQKTESETKRPTVTFSLDSAVVDPKGEIIDTKYGLNTYDLDENKNFMYKFNTNNRHGLEVIDLNKMELVDFVPFEVEGPNGTSSRVYTLNYISDDELALTVDQSILIFNNNGALQHKYPIANHPFEGDSLPKDFSMESSGLYTPEHHTSYNLINKGFGEVRGFSVLDLEANTRKTHLIDDLKQLDDYHISLTVDGRMMMIRTYFYTHYYKEKYILSNDMLNGLHYFDVKKDSVIHKTYKSELSANKNEIFGKETESRDELGKIMTSRNKNIRFLDIVYDEQRNQYYRFSAYSKSPEKEEDDWEIILTVFDENLNQINETNELPLEDVPKTYFVKDGKIYIYKNMQDEMGFLILSLSEQASS